jgi:chemotaxis protein methyltransferase WspC
MSEHGIRSRAKYLAILRCSRQERQSLVEGVRLPSRDFFAQIEPLRSLQKWVTNHWLARPSKKPLRVLSVPCATGEEPYSLAISLLESGLQADQFHIDTVDINDRALRHAAAAIYAEGALRYTPEIIRDRYFVRESSGRRMCAGVRSQVTFLKGDLLGSLRLSDSYDIIFGRSLLLYFVPLAQQRILKRLERSLRPGGLLIVGPSQPRKGSKSGIPAWVNSSLKSLDGQAPWGLPGIQIASSSLSEEGRAWLREAANLVDAHRCNEAASLCIRVLHEHRAAAQAVYLLGRIAQVEGRLFEAREFFRRALYLQPRHRQAQEHLKQVIPPTRLRRVGV